MSRACLRQLIGSSGRHASLCLVPVWLRSPTVGANGKQLSASRAELAQALHVRDAVAGELTVWLCQEMEEQGTRAACAVLGVGAARRAALPTACSLNAPPASCLYTALLCIWHQAQARECVVCATGCARCTGDHCKGAGAVRAPLRNAAMTRWLCGLLAVLLAVRAVRVATTAKAREPWVGARPIAQRCPKALLVRPV